MGDSGPEWWCSFEGAAYADPMERGQGAAKALHCVQVRSEIQRSRELICGARAHSRVQRGYAGEATRRARDHSARLVNGWADVCGLPSTGEGRAADDVYELVLDAARRQFDDCGSISLTTVDQLGGDELDGVTAASTGVADSADSLQYQLREGPCIDALELNMVGVVRAHGRTPADVSSWPRFTEAAAALGVRSFMSIAVPWSPLYVGLSAGRRALGAINFYAGRAGGFGQADAFAEMFGCWAGSILSGQEPAALHHTSV
jgi:hypothetical protein